MINRRGKIKMETVYIAGGCLWGVQHFLTQCLVYR